MGGVNIHGPRPIYSASINFMRRMDFSGLAVGIFSTADCGETRVNQAFGKGNACDGTVAWRPVHGATQPWCDRVSDQQPMIVHAGFMESSLESQRWYLQHVSKGGDPKPRLGEKPMRYIDNQFEWPILWRIGSGPRALRSLDEALEAVDHRLEEIEGRLVYSDEITALLGLRDVIEDAAVSLGPVQIKTAVGALRTFAATYRPMVAIPEGQSLDALFAYALSPRRRWDTDIAEV